VAKAGDVIRNPLTGEAVTFLVTSADSNGELLRVEMVAEPGAAGATEHLHPKLTESYDMQEGSLHVRLRDPEDRPGAERVLSQALGVHVRIESDPAALSARISEPQRVAHALAELSRSGVAVTDFALGQPSLDEVFLALTGRPAEDDDATDTGEDAA